MRYTAVFTLFVLVSTTLACKCLKNGNNLVDRTQFCCKVDLKGYYDAGAKDCQAHSISEVLRFFATCCRAMAGWECYVVKRLDYGKWKQDKALAEHGSGPGRIVQKECR
ncbi:hypothetical protein P171DRAFT_483692 [Karstenula rhodostoma CBS 690.94]|uniref:Extracellular membrane protein CFEM domain-containing protein n=1 Tax=Karstenula rhodostoma CBS 690.94 TaxID=1392251 RepID=A0A9P4UC51_9PLEO|nr:hypothetical protein P171DRAFT_483692 [Karstenula rhodostoma CBS 690.94]